MISHIQEKYQDLRNISPELNQILDTLCPNQSWETQTGIAAAWDAYQHGLKDPNMLAVILLFQPAYWNNLNPRIANAQDHVANAIDLLVSIQKYAISTQCNIVTQDAVLAIGHIANIYVTFKYYAESHAPDWLRAYYAAIAKSLEEIQTVWSEKRPDTAEFLNYTISEIKRLTP